MEDGEALVLHLLQSESHEVLFDKDEVGLVCFNRIFKIIFFDSFLWVSQVRRQNSNARCGLEILSVTQFIDNFFDRVDDNFRSQI